MASVLTSRGSVYYRPSDLGHGTSGSPHDLAGSGIYSQVLDDEMDLAAGSPFILPVSPVALLWLQVVSGGPITVLVTGSAGSDQAIQVSQSLVLQGSFLTVKLSGAARVAVLVAG